MHLKELVEKYNIRFKKGLGQNLLLDDNINRIMVDAASLTKDDVVVEIGAGLGALTGRLAAGAGRVLSVEIDRAFMPCLEDQFGAMPHVKLFRGDFLNHPFEKLLEEHLPGAQTCKVLSNLPYYITTPILFHIWESPVDVSRMVIMVQEEVALRMTAIVGAPDYGVLALAAQYHAEVDIVHKVPRTCFTPRPEVDSCVVRLRTRQTPLYPDIEARFLMRVIRTAFSQRRKTLRNALTRSGALGVPVEIVEEAFVAAEIDPGRRAQTLTLDDFGRLAGAIKARLQS